MIKSAIARLASNVIVPQIYHRHKDAVALQQNTLLSLVSKATDTDFGKEHGFGSIKNYSDFSKAVPLRDYENMHHYIDGIANGKPDVLWPGKPLYFCKSSGTTSGVKYIPVTGEQIKAMIDAARNSLLAYVHQTGKSDFFNHKMIFLQGTPALEKHGEIPTGRLSGIVYHHVPFYVNANRLPSYKINCIEDWEEKVNAIAKETIRQRMSLISGIPPWCVMYFDKLRELSGKEFIKDIFPDFSVFAYGGVNYEPYRAQIEKLVGFSIDSVETYPASEGFIAYQDSQTEKGLLLNLDAGIFYEFVKAEDALRDNPERISLQDVELNVNYALVLNTNAGLWGYSIGDTVKFVSKNPYRILVTGRIKHFISAFGEHVIGEEVEHAMLFAMRETHAGVVEFTVAPKVQTNGEPPYHEWIVEFSRPPLKLDSFAMMLDEFIRGKNMYYNDLRTGHVLQQLKIRSVPQGTFVNYMKNEGKLGGQNKVPRLTNDRRIADALLAL